MNPTTNTPFRVLIVGGGVAGLEAALALRELAGERVANTLLAPAAEFVYRPMRVREPFGYSAARRYPLDEICRDIGTDLVKDAFKWLDPDLRVVHTNAGEKLEYDALLLAPGAVSRPRFKHAITLDDSQLDEQLHGLIQDVEGGYVHKLAFISPTPMPWPLPLYELALMTARRAYDMNVDISVTLATPEDAPLALFGSEASAAVERLLEENGILFIPSAHCETPAPGELLLSPGSRRLYVDRVIALPELFGPSVPGVPLTAHNGFIPIDVHCKVVGLDRVYAAGDATDFAVKFGGIASQQADTAAEAIAALAGAPIEPKPFHPIIHGMLLGGKQPLYLTAHITGGHGSSSQATGIAAGSPGAKIAAKHLAPYLESRDRAALR
ncbi:MAG: FAD-dependent oxidoreductase [Solirubrobacteraceae bacterium]